MENRKAAFEANPENFGRMDETLYASFDTESDDRAICEVIMMNATGCVVAATYMERDPSTALAMSPDGDGLWLVPWTEITSLYNEADAETIVCCIEVDSRLLSYARG